MILIKSLAFKFLMAEHGHQSFKIRSGVYIFLRGHDEIPIEGENHAMCETCSITFIFQYTIHNI